jgi:hypothetical protein
LSDHHSRPIQGICNQSFVVVLVLVCAMDSFLDSYTGLLPFLIRAIASKSNESRTNVYSKLMEEPSHNYAAQQQQQRKLRRSKTHLPQQAPRRSSSIGGAAAAAENLTFFRTSSFDHTTTPRRSSSMQQAAHHINIRY